MDSLSQEALLAGTPLAEGQSFHEWLRSGEVLCDAINVPLTAIGRSPLTPSQYLEATLGRYEGAVWQPDALA